MAQDWIELTRLTQGREIRVERVCLTGSEIRVEGSFELPPLAKLSAEDQTFVIAFLRSHGSIKEMERLFGVSYPTIKSRMARIAAEFDYVEISGAGGGSKASSNPETRAEILTRLQNGELTAAQALELLKS